jgi:hypothetical protein
MESSLYSVALQFMTGLSLYFIIYGTLTRWQIVRELRGLFLTLDECRDSQKMSEKK